MKKVKFMLMAIALIAIVGGALAFKASNMYDEPLCYSTVPEGDVCPLTCPDFITLAEPNPEGIRVCTTDANLGVDEGKECLLNPDVPNVFKTCVGPVITITEE